MNSRGNAFIYILIAVVLFGALTFALSSTDQGNDITELNEGQTTIAVNEILSYAVAAQNTIAALDKMGTSAAQIDFIIPSDTSFNTGSALNKIFHPQGGGLTYKPLPRDAIDSGLAGLPKAGFYIGRFNNVEWTPTATNDVVFTAFGLTKPVCEALNLNITGSKVIPTLGTGIEQYLVVSGTYHAAGNTNLTVSDCGACENKPALCINSGAKYGFYSILVAR